MVTIAQQLMLPSKASVRAAETCNRVPLRCVWWWQKLVAATRSPHQRPSVTYLSPLAYLLGLEGVALLRGIRDGIGDQEFVEARIAEIRELLDDPALLKAGGTDAAMGGISTDDVYSGWAGK